MSFNLLDERWIPILGEKDGVSLIELFARAHDLRAIAGESPTMTAALYRLAIAVLHRAVGPPDEETWAKLWQDEQLPMAPIRDYLEEWRSRFDLFGDEPFYQCPALAGKEPQTAALLVPYRASGNNALLFDHTAAATKVTLTPAQAACWLVTAQGFDLGGTKSIGAGSDKFSTAAPGLGGAVILVRGKTVRETLLLNLVAYKTGTQPHGTRHDDAPAWEHPPLSATPRKAVVPRGWTDLLTWQSRRIWLRRTRQDDGREMVDGVLICPGDSLHKDFQLLHVEQHMAFFADGKTTLRIDRDRALWRSANALASRSTAMNALRGTAPRTLAWLARLEAANALKMPLLIPVTAYGVISKQSKLDGWMAEDIVLPTRLLDPRETVAIATLDTSIQVAEKVGRLLFEQARRLRGEFKTAKEIKDEKKKDWRPLELASYWAALTPEYDRLAHLVAVGEFAEARRLWRKAINNAATSALNRMLATGTSGPRSLAIRAAVANTVSTRLRQELAVLDTDLGALV